jgi:hypothetical protein
MKTLAVPALKKQFPALETASADEIDPEATVEVEEVLASDGYEWQDMPEWMDRFKEYLAA